MSPRFEHPTLPAWTLRHDLHPGDIGTVVQLHGITYAREYQFDPTFEAYVGRLQSRPARHTVTSQDFLVTFAVLLLPIEILKATRIGMRSIVDHLLSMALFIAMLVEFILVRQAGNSTLPALLSM